MLRSGEAGKLGTVSPYPNDDELKTHLRQRLAKVRNFACWLETCTFIRECLLY
jgi:hypothetical protein